MIIAPPTKVPIPGTSCRSRKLIRVDSSGERNIKFATSLVFSAYARAFAQRIQPTALEMIARYSKARKCFGSPVTLSRKPCIAEKQSHSAAPSMLKQVICAEV